MPNEQNEKSKSEGKNFIYNIIEEDIKNNKNEGKIITRFPPEPNGYLHIGHAKAICLSFSVAAKYGGKCNLRFDDTNPANEDMEYVNSIEEDVKWLGFSWDKKFWASDYFEKMYECAEKLIQTGDAYVCDLNADEIRETRGTLTEPGVDSPYRNRTIDENLKLFREMREGKFEDGSKVLRAKIDMSSSNINMRDPVIYRIARIHHHNTGDDWCIYPMYDFAHPLEDAIEGVTHSLCTLEFEDHRPLYDWFLEKLKWPNPPRQIEFARLNVTNTLMSKRKLKKLVDEGKVSGWDDPRMPTIAGIRRRGYTPASIRKFCDDIGVAKSNSIVDTAMLESCIRDDLKEVVVSKNVVFDPIKVVITNYPEEGEELMEIENNRNNEALGSRKVPFSRELYVDGEDFMMNPVKKYFRLFKGNEVRFKGAYFIKCNDVVTDDEGKVIELLCTYDPETRSGSGFDGRKVKGTIHWIDKRTAVKIDVNEYEDLFIKDGDEMKFNEGSKIRRECFAEPSIEEMNPGDKVQFFRHGYYTKDEDGSFNRITPLKSSWKK